MSSITITIRPGRLTTAQLRGLLAAAADNDTRFTLGDEIKARYRAEREVRVRRQNERRKAGPDPRET